MTSGRTSSFLHLHSLALAIKKALRLWAASSIYSCLFYKGQFFAKHLVPSLEEVPEEEAGDNDGLEKPANAGFAFTFRSRICPVTPEHRFRCRCGSQKVVSGASHRSKRR